MNALVTFRANGAGTLAPNPEDRQAVWQKLTASLRAKAGQAKMEAIQSAAQVSSTKGAGKASMQKAQAANASPDDGLGRDAFLQLLVAQMQNQDPLEPVSNTDMVAQLAQFSSLEQMTNLNTSFTEIQEDINFLNDQIGFLSGNIDQQNFISAQNLLGLFVEGVSVEGNVVNGKVESVHLEGSTVLLFVDDEFVPMSGVLGISEDRNVPSVPSDPAPDEAPEGS